jgi:TadE-like protein
LVRQQHLVRWALNETGQSLIELALALPVLLLILLVLADFGRAFYYTTILTNAAREGAAYLATNPSETPLTTAVKKRVCNETGFFTYDDVAGCSIVVTLGDGPTPPPYAAGQDAVVTVRYQFQLISSYLVGRVFSTDPVQLTAQARYPGLR